MRAADSSTYYGVDTHAADLPVQIEAAIHAHAPLPGGDAHHVHALIDGALDPAFGSELFAASQQADPQVHSVYAGTPLQAAQEHAPFVWSLTQQELPDLLARCNARPMLGLIQGPLEADALARHLSHFTLGQTDDSLRLALRIADPIALHGLLVALGDAFQEALCAGFAAWHLIGRNGDLHTWKGTAASAVGAMQRAPTAGPWPLSDAAFAQLVEDSEADRVLCEVACKQQALADSHSATELHRRVVALLAALDAGGVQQASRRISLVTGALVHADELTSVMWLKEQLWRTT